MCVNRRRGFTLIELLLVLAIIVITAAAVAPSLRGVVRNSALKAAAGNVRAELTRAHVRAMKTGRIHVFQYELGGTRYKVEPWLTGDDAIESKDGQSNPGPPPLTHAAAHEPALPEGIRFVMGDAAIESRSQRVEEEFVNSGDSGVTWSRPILFYPDGSSSDAFVVVGNDHQAGIRVSLRGMTGSAKIGELTDVKKLEAEQPLSR
jgi:type II secretion system protein H